MHSLLSNTRTVKSIAQPFIKIKHLQTNVLGTNVFHKVTMCPKEFAIDVFTVYCVITSKWIYYKYVHKIIPFQGQMNVSQFLLENMMLPQNILLIGCCFSQMEKCK